MSGADLQRVMGMLGSAHMKSQLRLLGAGALLDKLRDAVEEVHYEAVSKGANTKLALCIGYLSANLGDELEGVLRQQASAEAWAWHQLPAMVFSNRRLRRTTALRLTRSLHDFTTLASLVKYGGGSIRHDNLSSSSRAVISTATTQAAGGPIVGRWALIEKMVKRILLAGSGDASSSGRPLVLPIVGGPGIGKTRLAQALFLDDRVRLKFKLGRWLHISPMFHLASILMMIRRSRLSSDIIHASRTTLKILIREELRVGSYLLVLDDMWSDTAAGSAGGSMDLEAIVQALPPNGAIILTTRNPALASRMATSVKPYFLLPLGEKLSTCLSRRWTDSYGGTCPAELIRETGTIITKKCRGVPFLLEYACRLLCLPQLTMDFWLGFVGKSDGGNHINIGNLQRRLPSYIDMLPEEEFWQRFLQHCSSLPDADLVVKSACLSYQHLPLDLRGCLVYCSLFPSGYTFHAEQLAELLTMEGFIPPTVTEAQRQGFLQVLLDDCFHPVQEHGGTSTTYRMHTMLHIFAQYMDRECISVNRAGGQVIHITSKARAQQSVRHVSMVVDTTVTSFHGDLFAAFRDLRTFILLHQREIRLPDQPQCEIKVIPPQFCQCLGYLRVLSLESTKISMIPPRFEQLSSLRYLSLSQSDIETVPKSVSKLQFLQILILSRCEKLQKLHSNTTNLSRLQKLDLEGCRQLVELPQDLSKMRSLEYLNLLGCSLLAQMPRGVGQLYNLRTLLGYATPCSSDGRTISELQALPNLHRLSLECLDRVKEAIDARYAELEGKRNLESLQLRWNANAKTVGTLAYAVLESLRPPQRLKLLEIVSYEGDKFPTWLKGPQLYLNSLVEIRLVNLRACDKTLPSLGLLPCLKIAEISGAQDVICIDDSFYGHNGTFPSMERLTLSFMPNLEVWEEHKVTNAAIFPRLAELAIIQCPNFRELHAELPSVEKLTLWMNNEKLYSSIGGLKGVAASLEHVSISFCEELLASSGCEALHDLAVLERLDICGCHGLACLPQGFQHLSALRYLTVDNCSNLETLPGWLENIPDLRLLHLSGCAVLQSIPQDMRQTDLEIIAEECPNLPRQSVKSVRAQTKGKGIIGGDDLPFQRIDENEY